MSAGAMIVSDLYLKYTDDKGNTQILAHRCWDSATFFQARSDEAKKLRAKGDVKCKVELSDVNEWKKSRRA